MVMPPVRIQEKGRREDRSPKDERITLSLADKQMADPEVVREPGPIHWF